MHNGEAILQINMMVHFSLRVTKKKWNVRLQYSDQLFTYILFTQYFDVGSLHYVNWMTSAAVLTKSYKKFLFSYLAIYIFPNSVKGLVKLSYVSLISFNLSLANIKTTYILLEGW